MARKKIDFSDLETAIKEEGSVEPERKRTTDYLGHRQNALSNMAKVENKKCIWVDPKRCRIWEGHDRFYALLNPDNCAELINDFHSSGKQIKPAIVRPVSDDPNYDWEVIDGARRHWVVSYLRENNYPEFEYFVEPRSLTDEAAFRLSDSSHKHRDICDYERAVKYWKALNEYHYYNSQKEMAERLHHTEAWLSRFLDLASIPAEVTDAFPSIFEIKVEHAKVLKPFLKRDKTKKELIKRAKEINQQQEANLAQEKAAMPASKVISLLTEIFKEKKSKQVSEYLAEDGSKLFIIEQKGRGALSISLTPKAKGNKDETLKQLNEALEALYGE